MIFDRIKNDLNDLNESVAAKGYSERLDKNFFIYRNPDRIEFANLVSHVGFLRGVVSLTDLYVWVGNILHDEVIDLIPARFYQSNYCNVVLTSKQIAFTTHDSLENHKIDYQKLYGQNPHLMHLYGEHLPIVSFEEI